MASPANSACRRALLQGAFLCGLALAAYWPALRGGFILDDDVFLTQNPLIKAADGLGRFWFTRQAVDYWPMTSTSLWIEWRWWGMNPVGYHATNLALHLAAALLLWRILLRLEIPGAFLAALLFAVHPLNVESIAWITQRKNALAMVIYLASIWCFLKSDPPSPTPVRRLVRRSVSEDGPPTPGPSINLFYGLSLFSFVFALLAKGSVAPLPFVLLGLIAWRRRVSVRDGLRLLPFFAGAAFFTVINISFQNQGNGGAVRHTGLVERFLGACAIPWFYLTKILLPIHLLFIYPQWQIEAGNALWWLAPIATLGLSLFLIRHRHGRARPIAFGWGYFCVMLLPVMGLTDIRFMRFSLVADHYAHLAMIGVLVPAGALWARAQGAGFAATARVVAAAVVGGFTVLTWQQCRLYRDAQTLYTAALKGNPSSSMLHNNLGFAWQEEGRRKEALAQYETAVALKPNYAEAQNNLGALLSAMGRTQEAVRHCEEAVRLNPDFADANDNLGVLRARQGRTEEGIALFQRALAENPEFARAHYNLAGAWESLGRRPEALAELEETVRLEPNFAEARNSLGGILLVMGRTPEARVQVSEAIRLKPDLADAHTNLGVILRSEGRPLDAQAQFDLANRLKSAAQGDSP